MSELIIREQALDSREVAQMVEKEHKNLLADIRGYVSHMKNTNELIIQPVNFFIESTYVDSKGEVRPCFHVTRKGCEFIANKLTGQKGTHFTANYINKFHELEKTQTPTQHADKNKRLEIQEKNARVRMANIYLRIADNSALPEDYRSIFLSYASKEASGEEILPLPKTEQKTYSAGEIGAMLGLSGNKIGRLANEHNLKTNEYGQLYHDKSRHSAKEVDSFRYFDTAIPKFEEITGLKLIK